MICTSHYFIKKLLFLYAPGVASHFNCGMSSYVTLRGVGAWNVDLSAMNNPGITTVCIPRCLGCLSFLFSRFGVGVLLILTLDCCNSGLYVPWSVQPLLVGCTTSQFNRDERSAAIWRYDNLKKCSMKFNLVLWRVVPGRKNDNSNCQILESILI